VLEYALRRWPVSLYSTSIRQALVVVKMVTVVCFG